MPTTCPWAQPQPRTATRAGYLSVAVVPRTTVYTPSQDARLVAALSRVEELERENEALQEAAAKRDLILAHSKKFIESYLQKSAALLDKNGQP